MQVELIHVVQDVVAVRSDQVLVVVDLLLWRSNTKSVNNTLPCTSGVRFR